MWHEAARSAFAVATILPSAMDPTKVCEIFENLEKGDFDESKLTAFQLATLRNSVCFFLFSYPYRFFHSSRLSDTVDTLCGSSTLATGVMASVSRNFYAVNSLKWNRDGFG